MNTATEVPRPVLERICSGLGLQADEVQVSKLEGGLYGRTLLLSADGVECVLRLPLRNAAFAGLDLAAEQRLVDTLGIERLGPRLIPSDPLEGILITAYLSQTRAWQHEDARRPENIPRLAARLRDLHNVDYTLPPFHATDTAQRYCRSFESERTLDAVHRAWRDEFLSLAADYDAQSDPSTLCHNDLIAANILDDGELWFIDFEYAVCAEPILDLASYAAMNDLDAQQRALLLSSYYADGEPPFTMKWFADVVRLSRYIAYFWAAAGQPEGRHDGHSQRFVERMATVLR